MTDPDWEPIKTGFSDCDQSRWPTRQAAIIARELGIPAIVGCGDGKAGARAR